MCVGNALGWRDNKNPLNTNYIEGKKKEVKLYKILLAKLKQEKSCHNLNFLAMKILSSCFPL